MNLIQQHKSTYLHTMYLQDDYGNKGVIFHDFKESSFWKLWINFKYSKYCFINRINLERKGELATPKTPRILKLDIYKIDINKFVQLLKTKEHRFEYLSYDDYYKIIPKEKKKNFKPRKHERINSTKQK